MYTVLLTDGEFTGMIRALRDYGDVRIVGFVFSEFAAHSTMLDASYIAPEWNDPNYGAFLEEVIRKEKVDIVFPVVTKSLEFMASIADSIKEKTGATVVTSSEELIRIANNKASLLDHLEKAGDLKDAVTSHYVAGSLQELLSGIRKFEEEGTSCVIKPVLGENRDGFMRIVSEEAYAKAFSEGRSSLFMTRKLLEAMPEKLDFSVPMLIMPYLPGQEWDVDILAENGQILSCTIRKNIGMLGGLSACTETSDNPELFRLCEKILSVLPLSHMFCMSFKEDASGHLKLLEINPRTMGSIYVSTLAGNSLVSAFFRHLENPGELTGKAVITSPGCIASLYYDLMRLPEDKKSSPKTSIGAKSTFTDTSSDRPVIWKKLTRDFKDEYLRYYAMTDTKITDLTFHCRYAWDGVFNIEYAIIEDCLVQISDGDGYTSPFMMMPLGNLDSAKLIKIIEKVRPVFDERGWTFRVLSIDAKYKDMFLSLPFPIHECTFDRDSSDYLYDADSLRNLTGKKYAKKRNHLKHFLSEYPEHEYLALERSIFPECLDLVRNWAEKKQIDLYDTLESDYLMIERCFRDWDKLDLRGGAIRINGRIVAFSIGSIGKPDTAHIHFEKADTDYDGLSVAQCKYVASRTFPEVRFINREEDLGMPGLRQSKESYCPIAMVDKYKVILL